MSDAKKTTRPRTWLREWWVTLRYGSPLTGAGRTLRRNMHDHRGEYVAVDRPVPLARVSMTDAEKDAAVDAVLEVMDGRLHRESHHVADWPDDEAHLHRHGDWHSFDERAERISRLRARKIVEAVLGVLPLADGDDDA